eukprot:365891-Chlamydomonas_euryale.AAC.14
MCLPAGLHVCSVSSSGVGVQSRSSSTGSVGIGASSMPREYYRADGVRITHDPYAPGMVEKYGAPGSTDREGFDPYADSVGPGIYGGRVERDPATGNVVVGEQYQGHNPRPGPVYAGGGYAPVADALKGPPEARLVPLLKKYPDLVNDITTGGAQPLHMCGMSAANQAAVPVLVAFGADIEALDTYGMTPLHRMASNNLAEGARQLLAAGADPNHKGRIRSTPADVARESRATHVLQVLREFAAQQQGAARRWHGRGITHIEVLRAGVEAVNGLYERRPSSEVPASFARVCEQELRTDAASTWEKLNGDGDWYRHCDHPANASYIYYNRGDKHWWIDGPSGLGAYKSPGPPHAPPANGVFPANAHGGWLVMEKGAEALSQPVLRILREGYDAGKWGA